MMSLSAKMREKTSVKVQKEKIVICSEAQCQMWEYQFTGCQALDLAGSIVRSVLKSRYRIKEFGTPLRALKLNSTLCTANC